MNKQRRPDPENLSGLELIREICEAQGDKYIGSPTAGYATYDEKNDKLVILADSDGRIQYPSIDELMFETSMDLAKQMGASFIVYRNQIICTIQGISKSGESYSEATLRTLLAHHQKKRI